jgi:hypothetical protein
MISVAETNNIDAAAAPGEIHDAVPATIKQGKLKKLKQLFFFLLYLI